MIDSYQALLEQLDDWHAKNVDANEIAWLQTARQLDRTIAAGARMAELLTDIARSADTQQRDEIGSRLNAWHHATNTR
jgi:hypothetical protein